MRIGTNIFSLSAQRQLSLTARAIARSLEKLSSGKDTDARLKTTHLEAQKKGTERAIKNIGEAIGFLNASAGALQAQRDIISRLKELALRASNGTLTDIDRVDLDNQFQDLLTDFDRIASRSEFNGIKLLDGTFGSKTVQAGSRKGDTIRFDLSNTTKSAIFIPPTENTEATYIGTGTFSTSSTIGDTLGAGSTLQILLTGDWNNDGYDDIAEVDTVDGTGVSVFFSNGNGTFGARITIATTGNYFGGDVGDLNGDGFEDFMFSDNGPHAIEYFLSNGNGTFAVTQTVAGANNPNDVKLADVNADGKLDAIIAGGSAATPRLSVRLGNGNGTFQTAKTAVLDNSLKEIDVGDFNSDGIVDIAMISDNGDWMGIGFGNGNGTFSAVVSTAILANPESFQVADLNGDGKDDIAIIDVTAGLFQIYLSNGNGTFQTVQTFTVSGGPKDLIAADLNGDGKIDLIHTRSSSTNIGIHLGNGNGTFQTMVTYSAPAGNNLAIGDFNGDGVQDIVQKATSTPMLLTTFFGDSTLATAATEGTLSIATQSEAESMLSVIDDALESILTAESKITAYLSRFEHATNYEETLSENLFEAISDISDTDFVNEIAELTRLQILENANVAVLSSAQLETKLALELLDLVKVKKD